MGIFSRLKDIAKTVSNVPGEFSIGALKGLGSTALSVGNIGASAMDKVLGTITGSDALDGESRERGMQQIKDVLAPTSAAQKVGFAAEQIGEFFAPGGVVGSAAKVGSKVLGVARSTPKVASTIVSKAPALSKIITSGAKVAKEAANAAGISFQQTGDAKEALVTGALQASIGPAFNIAGKVAGAVSGRLTNVLSGVPKEAIDYAFNNPDKVLKSISSAVKNGDESIMAVTEKTKTAFSQLKKLRKEAYEANLAKLGSETYTTKAGTLYVKKPDAISKGEPILVPTKLTTLGLKSELSQQLKKFGVKFNKRIVDVSESKLPNEFNKRLQEVADEVYNWKKIDPLGLDTLISRLQGQRLQGVTTGEKQFNSMLGEITDNINTYVAKRVPQIGELRSTYHTQSKTIEMIEDELFSGKESTLVRKLSSAFSPNQPFYRKVVAELGEKTGKDILSDIAGVLFSQWTPQGLGKYITATYAGSAATTAALGSFGTIAALPVVAAASSPRVAGTMSAWLGKVVPAVRNAYSTVAPAVSGLLGKISGAFMPQEENNSSSDITSGTDTNVDSWISQNRDMYQMMLERMSERPGMTEEKLRFLIKQKISQ